MKPNHQTILFDIEEESEDFLEPLDSSESLSAAYAALGKAFYEYRFEEPTPELLLYFDHITKLLKEQKNLEKQRKEHLETFLSHDLKTDSVEEDSIIINSRSIPIPPKATRPPHRSSEFYPGSSPKEEIKIDSKPSTSKLDPIESQKNSSFLDLSNNLASFEKSEAIFSNNDNYTRKLINTYKVEANKENNSNDSIQFNKNEALKPMKSKELRCPKCGYVIAADDLFCGNCGNKLNS